jgi:hypothetical protein
MMIKKRIIKEIINNEEQKHSNILQNVRMF